MYFASPTALLRRIGPTWWYSFGLFATSMVGAVVNMYTGLFYLPVHLSPGDLGAIEPVTRLAAFGAIPLTVIGKVAVKYLSTYHARGEFGKVKWFIRDMGLLAGLFSLVFSIVLLSCFEAVSLRLNIGGRFLLLGLIGLIVTSCWQPLMNVVLQGLQTFWVLMVGSLLHPVCLLLFVVLLVPPGRLSGLLIAKFLSSAVPIGLGLFGLRHFLARSIQGRSYYAEWTGILRFSWPILVVALAGWTQDFVGPFVIKHRLSDMDAAGYYMACRLGQIPSYLVASIVFVLYPMLSHRHERGESTIRLFGQGMVGTALIGSVGVLLLGLTAERLFSWVAAWRPYLAYADYVWKIGIVVVLQALIITYSTHEMARRKFSYLYLLVPMALLEAAVLYVAFGWGGFRPYLPEVLWRRVHDILPLGLPFVVWVMVGARLLTLSLLGCHWAVCGNRAITLGGCPEQAQAPLPGGLQP